jgi:hypothetical protein
MRSHHAVVVLLALLVACNAPARDDGAPPSTAGTDSPPSPGAATPASDSVERHRELVRIESLKVAARTTANPEGCSTAGQCAAIALGSKACGGPTEYLVYCPRSTDTLRLRELVDEVERAERAYNTRWGIVSTCEMLLEPRLVLEGDVCRAAPATGEPIPR